MSEKKLAVVTGGAGFIGSHMVDLLVEKGFRVRVIDNLVGGRRQNLDQHQDSGDVVLFERDLATLAPEEGLFDDAHFVFHFAGIGDIVPSIEAPIKYMQANVLGTVNALEGARRAGAKKFVYAASSSCYGLTDELPTTETASIHTEYPYALSKYQGEQAVFHWGKVYKLPVNSIRIFNAYGPRSRTSGAYGAVFGVFLKQLLAGSPLTVVGDGTQTRDFVFVTDLARAFYAAADTEHCGEVFNIGAGKPQSVNRLVELLNVKEKAHLPKRPGEPDCTWADISKAERLLGWKPEVSFEKGVSIMLENVEYWRNAPLWDVKSIEAATKTWFECLSGA
ncbi:MAG: GDP-mannose 4,6-dehydratase [Pirellulaceae bacterium]